MKQLKTILGKRFLLMGLALLSTTLFVNAQTTVSGNITDNSGPLPGVTILEKGTTNGTVSDFDGNYTLSIENQNAVLVFSYLGFLTQEVSASEDEIQTGSYDDGSGGIINGVDTRESPIENWNGSRTSYNNRKFIDPDPSLVENLTSHQVIPWPFIRYAEAVLNYVEASIELGQEDEARTWLNKIRFRVGMPAVTDTGEDLKARYRNERRIELAFEEHRYHDARRWLIASETLGRGIQVMNITAKLKAGKSPIVPYKHDKSVYDYTYKVQNNTELENRTWKDKMYYRPISRDEINKNELLVQNPGY